MFERFNKTLLGLFRSRSARPGAKPGTRPASVREEAVAQIRQSQGKVMTPQRAELIRNAMEVHRAKKAILADLDDEQKQRLVALALRAFLNEGRDDAGAAQPAGKNGAKGGGKASGKAPAPKAKKGR